MKTVEELRAEGIDVAVMPSKHTVYFENIYGENQDNRTQRVLAKADPFTVEYLENIDSKIFHGIQAAHSSVSPAPSGKTPHIPLQVITIGRFARVPSAQAPLSIIFSEGSIFFTATQILIIYFIP